MLHCIPTVAEQHQAFAEVARVLRRGGTFAGTDSIGIGWLFHAIHVGDTLNPVNPDDLPAAPRALRPQTWTKWGAAAGRFGGGRESLKHRTLALEVCICHPHRQSSGEGRGVAVTPS